MSITSYEGWDQLHDEAAHHTPPQQDHGHVSYPDPGSGTPDANTTDSRRKPAALTKGIPRTTDMIQAYLVQSTAAREVRSYA